MGIKKKPSTKQAYENARKLRILLRDLSRAAVNGGYSAEKSVKAAQGVTDAWVKEVTHKSTQIQLGEALKTERECSMRIGASGLGGALVDAIQESYDLVQVIPSWDGLPEGELENKLKAIEALLKSSNAEYHPGKVLKSIKLIVGNEKFKAAPLPKKKAPKKQPSVTMSGGGAYALSASAVSAYALAKATAAALINPDTGVAQSPYNHQEVVKQGPEGHIWGYHAPYYMIKKGTPITWGGCEVWVDKGPQKPGQSGDKFYVHPDYAALAHQQYHAAAMKTGMLEEELTISVGDTVAQLNQAAIDKNKEKTPLHATD